MEFVKFVLALSPIALVLAGILVMRKPAMKVAPVAMVWTIILAFTMFNVQNLPFAEHLPSLYVQLEKGIVEGLKIVFMVLGAFVILNTLRTTGAIDDVKHTVAEVSGSDRRVQLIIIGMFVNTNSAIVLFGPIMAAIAAAVGVDNLAFGIIMVTNLCIGMVTPPVGSCFYISQKLSNSSFDRMLKELWPPVACLYAVVILISCFPQIVTWLPYLFR